MAAYHSAYQAELYDLTMVRPPWVTDDAPTYLNAYKQLHLLRPQDPAQEYLILDIGTGSGRVFRNLADDFIREDISPDRARFIGVDISPHMITRAIETVPKSLSSRITYTVGSALELDAVEGLQGPPVVDLLIFAFSSITHLAQPGAAEQFLHQVARVLRPGSGRAYIPIGYVFDEGRAIEASRVVQECLEVPLATDIPSEKFPNIVYRLPKGYMVTKREGQTMQYDVRLQVLEKTAEDQERVIELETSTSSCRIWRESEFLSAAETAGLQLVEEKQGSNETFYVFCVPTK